MASTDFIAGETWLNAKELYLLKNQPFEASARRQYLVFVVPKGDVRSPLLDIMHRDRNFDVAARFYDDPGKNRQLAVDSEYVMTGGLSKFHAAALFFEACGLQDIYDGYLFLDGDLEFDVAQLSNFLSLAHEAKFDLAQPSLTRESYCYWRTAFHQPGFIFRTTSFVEVMAPYISRSALSKTLVTFTQSISTYGLDLVWPSLIGGKRIAVVDAFQITHRDRVDHVSGAFYKYLKSIGVDLIEEERKVLAEYSVTRQRAHSRRGYLWKRRWPFLGQTKRMVSVSLGEPELRSQKQTMIDAAMCWARWSAWSDERPEDDLAMNIGPYLSGNSISIARI